MLERVFCLCFLITISLFAAVADEARVLPMVEWESNVDGELGDWRESGEARPEVFNYGAGGELGLYSGWSETGFHFGLELEEGHEQDLALFLDLRESGIGARLKANRTRFAVDYFIVENESRDEERIEESSDRVQYSRGVWREFSANEELGETIRYHENAMSRGFSLEVPFEGTSVKVGSVRSFAGGVCDVYIDDRKVGEIDLYHESGNAFPGIVFESGSLAPGEHVLRLENKPVDESGIYRLLIEQGGGADPVVSLWGKAGRLDFDSVAVKENSNGGWVAEGAIPWSLLGGFEAYYGGVMGMDCISDDSSDGVVGEGSERLMDLDWAVAYAGALGTGEESLPQYELAGHEGRLLSDGVQESLSRLDPGRIVIDGEVSDWKGHPFEALGSDSANEGSFAALSYAGWSEDGLYFAAKIYDDEILSPSSDLERLRRQDCFELFVDARESPVDLGNGSRGHFYMDCLIVEKGSGEVEFIEEDDARVSYTEGNWDKYESWGFMGMSAMRNLARDRSLSIEASFEGSRIKIAADLFAHRVRPAYDVYIDGELRGEIRPQFDDPWTSSKIVYDSGELPDGEHSIRIERRQPQGSGVVHLLVRPDADEGELVFGYDADGEVDLSDSIKVTRNDKGWSVEGMIPIRLLGNQILEEGKGLRFASRLYDWDEGSAGLPRALGLERHGNETTVEWMMENPSRFPFVTLGEANAESVLVDAYVKEVLDQGEGRLDVDIKLPLEYLEVSSGESVRGSFSVEDGVERGLTFMPSVGGRFLRAKHSEPIAQLKVDEELLEVTVAVDHARVENFDFKLYPVIDDELRRVQREFTDDYIASLDEEQRAVALLHKDCAEELVRHFEDKRNRDIEGFHLLRYYEDRRYLRNSIDALIEHGRIWISDIEEGIGDEFEYRKVWQSKIDNSWQFFEVSLPDGFEKGKAYQVELNYHIMNKYRFSRANQLIGAFRGGLGSGLRFGEGGAIAVRLFGRGNSFANLGDEELEYVLEWLEEEHPESTGSITMRGPSYGAKIVAEQASRHLEVPSLIDLNSPAIGVVYPDLLMRSYDGSRIYEILENGVADRVSAFQTFPTRITVGTEDEHYYDYIMKLHTIIAEGPYETQLDVMEGFPHAIPRYKIPEVEIAPKVKGEYVENFKMLQSNLRYGKAFGVQVWSKELSWRPFSVKLYNPKEGMRYLATQNTKTMSVDLKRLLPVRDDQLLVVDKSILRIGKSDFEGPLQLTNMGWRWVKSDRAPFNIEKGKTPGLQGPIGDIEQEGFLIVYGTQNVYARPILRERAARVVRHRTGSDKGQWEGGKFRIVADVDVDESDKKKWNLWLIGNRSENSLVDELLPLLGHDMRKDEVVVDGKQWSGDRLFLEVLGRNPKFPDRYVYIEAGQTIESYHSDILLNRLYDFAVTEFDAVNNPFVAKGVFDADWSLDSDGAKVWVNDE